MKTTWIVFVYLGFCSSISGQHAIFKKESGYIDRNTTYWVSKSTPGLFMKMNFSFNISFPSKACCPIFNMGEPGKKNCSKSNRLLPQLAWNSNKVARLGIGSEGSSISKCSYIMNGTTISCSGKSEFLYYHMKERYFYLEYECGHEKNLQGLNYSISVSIWMSTHCEPLEVPGCQNIQFTSYPTSFGDRNLVEASKTLEVMRNIIRRPNSNCYRKAEAERLACNSVFFGCKEQGFQTSLVVPCREACLDGVTACKREAPIIEYLDCSYFPFRNESNHCVYEPITCSEPEEINHGTIKYPKFTINSSLQIPANGNFSALTRMEYICNDGYLTQDSNFSECLFTGLWSPTPSCVAKNGMEELIVSTGALFGIMALCFSIIVPLKMIHKKCQRKHHRDKLHDIFLSYHDDRMNNPHHPEYNRVWNTVIPYLEDTCDPPFEVMTHPRNFVAGKPISESIRYFIGNSNSIIILMSQGYVSSHWCQMEFEESYFENRRDPAFRMIVILLEPNRHHLGNLTSYMESFLENRTYLTLQTPNLWDQVRDIIRDIRTPPSKKQNGICRCI